MKPIPSLSQQSLPASLDVQRLQAEARARIEALASEIWTDYNLHDPGITILEILSYAITDLGMRSRLEMETYLAGNSEDQFYTAREILPGAAHTIDDYRRLLLSEPNIGDARITALDGEMPEGLYELGAFFEDGTNESWISYSPLTLTNDAGQSLEVEVLLVPPIFQDLEPVWLSDNVISGIELETEQLVRLEHRFVAPLLITFRSDEDIETQIRMNTWIYIRQEEEQGLAESWDQALNSSLIPILRENSADNENIFPRFHQRVRQLQHNLDRVRAKLLAHRNLCEDWISFNPLRIQQIAVNIDRLDLKPDVSPESVLAEIYFSLSHFISPPTRPNTLAELLDEGLTVEEIFEGPLSDNGFIPQAQFAIANQNNILYTSDLVRIIMAVPGVISVSGLSIRAFMDRQEVNSGASNCINLLDRNLFYIQFSAEDCQVSLFRRGVNININRQDVLTHLAQLHEGFQESIPSPGPEDLPMPEGKKLNLASYHSIQNDFPQTYGLREGEITSSMPLVRQAQAKQLKAYLLFFEQLLANYCSQLAHIGDLFSMNKEIDQTYFHQPLYGVPAVRDLYEAFRQEQLGPEEAISWEQFQQNCNQYRKDLREDLESHQAFADRRNRFVDHLLARFGESFTDYANWNYARNGGQLSTDLLTDQLDMLQTLPKLQQSRAQAFNYSNLLINEQGDEIPNEMWNTTNVSGLEKRIASLLGMVNYQRRSLAAPFFENAFSVDVLAHFESIPASANEDDERRLFRLWNVPLSEIADRPEARILLRSRLAYDNEDDLNMAIQRTILSGQTSRAYINRMVGNTRYETCWNFFELWDQDPTSELNVPLAIYGPSGSSQADIDQYIQECIHTLQGRPAEGFHLIEHVLLRPIDGSREHLQAVSLSPGEDLPGQEFISDPYSFQVSIFLPLWTGRFQDPEFRVVVEKKIREEMPAHLLPWIYWVGVDASDVPLVFVQFEQAFQNWLENLYSADRATYQDAFIQALHSLRSLDFVQNTNQIAYSAFNFGQQI